MPAARQTSRASPPVEHYARYIDDYLESLEAPRRAPSGAQAWQAYEYQKYVLGQWGPDRARFLGSAPDRTATPAPPHPGKDGKRHRECSAGAALAAAEKELAGPDTDIET